jgi:hypothetical protein
MSALIKREDLARAHYLLDTANTSDTAGAGVREHLSAGGLLLVSAHYGKSITDYYRLAIVTLEGLEIEQRISHLTWAYSQVFGYSLREIAGRDYLAVSGGGFDKADELARTLAQYYGLERVRFVIV